MRSAAVKQQKGMGTAAGRKSLLKSIIGYKSLYLILIPGIIFFIIFSYGPMYGIQLAFKNFNPAKGILGSPWVGLEKFRRIWSEPGFWSAFRNTIVLSFLKIACGFPVPIIIAILLNELRSVRIKRTLQTIYTFPHFLSWVIISGIIINLLGHHGAVNNLIFSMGGERQGFLIEPQIFRAILVFSGIWKESGWDSIMYLAAITAIDPNMYESATIDGASRWHKIRYITWPGMTGIAAVLLILRLGQVMNAGFDEVINLYSPPVFETADILDTYIYRQTFQVMGDFGYSTAVGLFKGVINCTLMLCANTITKRIGQYGII